MTFFTSAMHIPAPFAFLAIMAEFLGGLGLILGLLARIAAIGIAVNIAAAVLMVHIHNGLFMNWYGNQKGEGRSIMRSQSPWRSRSWCAAPAHSP